MKVEFDNPDPGYYETILQWTLEALRKGQNEAAPLMPSWWTKARIFGTTC